MFAAWCFCCLLCRLLRQPRRFKLLLLHGARQDWFTEPGCACLQTVLGDVLGDLPPVHNWTQAERAEYISKPRRPFQVRHNTQCQLFLLLEMPSLITKDGCFHKTGRSTLNAVSAPFPESPAMEEWCHCKSALNMGKMALLKEKLA